MDVLHGAEELRDESSGFRFGGVDFVAHGDVADSGVRKIGADVGFDPSGGVRLEVGDVGVGDVEDELDVGPAEGREGVRVGVVYSHSLDSVGLVELDDVSLRR